MKEGLFHSYSAFTKLVLALLIWISITFFITLLVYIIAIPIFGFNFFEMESTIKNLDFSENSLFFKYFQICTSIGAFIISPFIIGFLINRNPVNYLKLNRTNTIIAFIISAIVMLGALPVINFFAEINSKLQLPEFLSSIEVWIKEKEEAAQDLTLMFVEANSFSQFLFNLLMIAIIPAIGEELLFRGIIQRLCVEWTKNIHWGVLIASFLFSFLHLQFYGFIPRLLLGMLLGYIFIWSKSIWLPIFAHFINNGVAVFAYYKFGAEYVSENIDTIGTTNDSKIYFIISIVFVIFLLYFLKKKLVMENDNRLNNGI